MRNLLITIVMSGLATVLVAQETSSSPIEITTTDITKLGGPIRSVNLTVFGIALGDQTDAAQEKARSAGFRTEVVTARQANGSRFIRVFSSEKEILGLTDEGGTITGLTLRNDFAPRLPGESSKLFEAAIRWSQRRPSGSDCLGVRIVARRSILEARR
jgi:hypothetical protein